MNRVTAFAGVLLLAGCSFKTRADLAAEATGRGEQRQTVAQQRATAAEGPAQFAEAPAPAKIVKAAPVEEDMDTQMRNLNGRVDTLENAVSQQTQTQQAKEENIAKEKAAIDQKFKDYEEALKKLELQVTALTEEVTKLKTAPPPPPPVVEAPPAAPAVKKSAFAEGEERFATKKWKEAIVSYQKYRDTNPKGKQYPEATYKIGVSFQEIGMKDEARAFFEEVQSKFPKSAESRKAAIRLKTLK